MNVPYLYQVHDGAPPPRAGLHHPSVAPYGAYAAADGKQVLISIQNEREWRMLCTEVLERPALADDPAFRQPHQAGGEPRGASRTSCGRACDAGRGPG